MPPIPRLPLDPRRPISIASPSLQERPVGVGEKPEIVEQEVPDQERSAGNGRRGSARKSARKRATASDVEVPVPENTATRDRRASRDRSLNRLLAGL
ncbi:MAG TPA: hypothetical protein VI259_21050, partial [Gemmatimonadaceae bacterium]